MAVSVADGDADLLTDRGGYVFEQWRGGIGCGNEDGLLVEDGERDAAEVPSLPESRSSARCSRGYVSRSTNSSPLWSASVRASASSVTQPRRRTIWPMLTGRLLLVERFGELLRVEKP